MRKQTSVDFLIEEFSAIFGKVNFTAMQGLLLKDAVEEARVMHEIEITEAFEDGTKFYLQRRSRLLKQNKQKNRQMILTDKTIIDEIALKNIVIEPLIEANIGTNSVDLTLSKTLLMYTDHVLDVRKKPQTVDIIIPDEGLILKPGILYLASTVEYTETLRHVPIIQGKSSLGRLGLFVHITAGFGDVNFKGHWTLELACIQPVKIYPGMKIAQICYHDISEMPYTDYASKADAKYSNQGSDPVASKNYLNK
jgi:dCTP deaminase